MAKEPIKNFAQLMAEEYVPQAKIPIPLAKDEIETSFIETDNYIVEQIYAEHADGAELSTKDGTWES